MLPNEAIVAYTAGFFDGEGCLGEYGKSRFAVRVSQGEANNGGVMLEQLRALKGLAKLAGHSERGTRNRAKRLKLPDRRTAKANVRNCGR